MNDAPTRCSSRAASVPLVAVEFLGSLEHQMLEDMGRSGVAGQLVSRADAIDDPEGNHRRHRCRRSEYGQTVSRVAPLADAAFALHLFKRIRQVFSSNPEEKSKESWVQSKGCRDSKSENEEEIPAASHQVVLTWAEVESLLDFGMAVGESERRDSVTVKVTRSIESTATGGRWARPIRMIWPESAVQPAAEDELLLLAGRSVFNHQLHVGVAAIRVPTLEDARPIGVLAVDGSENLRSAPPRGPETRGEPLQNGSFRVRPTCWGREGAAGALPPRHSHSPTTTMIATAVIADDDQPKAAVPSHRYSTGVGRTSAPVTPPRWRGRLPGSDGPPPQF